MEGHGILACGCAVRLASAREPANGFLGVPRGHRQREADLFALPCPFPSLILGKARGHRPPKRGAPADPSSCRERPARSRLGGRRASETMSPRALPWTGLGASKRVIILLPPIAEASQLA